MYDLTDKEKEQVHELSQRIAIRMSELYTLQAAIRILEGMGEVELAERIRERANIT